MKDAAFARRIGFAIAGWRTVWRNERSFRTQLAIGACMVVAAATLMSAAWLAVMLLTIGMVLALECMNAALEYLSNTVHPDIAPGIGHAKDAAAGAVLIASLTAVGVAAAYSVLS